MLHNRHILHQCRWNKHRCKMRSSSTGAYILAQWSSMPAAKSHHIVFFSQTCPSEYITQLYGNASQSWAERKRSRASKRDSNRMNPESNGAHNGCYHMDTPATLHTSPSHQCWGTLLWKGRTDLKPDVDRCCSAKSSSEALIAA